MGLCMLCIENLGAPVYRVQPQLFSTYRGYLLPVICLRIVSDWCGATWRHGPDDLFRVAALGAVLGLLKTYGH